MEDELYINVTGVEDGWSWSNLGGMGPDYTVPGQGDTLRPPTIRRSRVGRIDGKLIDLVVSNVTEYLPYTTQFNTVTQQYAGINLAAPKPGSGLDKAEMHLKFTFVEHATDTPYVLRKFRMAFFDFDTSQGGVVIVPLHGCCSSP